jgi:hemerythrin-like metal-binding domain
MVYIDWNTKYTLGIRTIDAQHKQIISLINSLYIVVQTQHNHDTLHDFISEVTLLLERHMHFEEDLMTRIQYPDQIVHAKSHKEIAQVWIYEIQQIAENEPTYPIPMINQLISNHILIDDKGYADYIFNNLT